MAEALEEAADGLSLDKSNTLEPGLKSMLPHKSQGFLSGRTHPGECPMYGQVQKTIEHFYFSNQKTVKCWPGKILAKYYRA
jgi:hypothetical protein